MKMLNFGCYILIYSYKTPPILTLVDTVNASYINNATNHLYKTPIEIHR